MLPTTKRYTFMLAIFQKNSYFKKAFPKSLISLSCSKNVLFHVSYSKKSYFMLALPKDIFMLAILNYMYVLFMLAIPKKSYFMYVIYSRKKFMYILYPVS